MDLSFCFECLRLMVFNRLKSADTLEEIEVFTKSDIELSISELKNKTN